LFTAAQKAQSTGAAKHQLHHEGHEAHEGVFINVFSTLRGLRALRGQFLLSRPEMDAFQCNPPCGAAAPGLRISKVSGTSNAVSQANRRKVSLKASMEA
jgi:hypothetical protein